MIQYQRLGCRSCLKMFGSIESCFYHCTFTIFYKVCELHLSFLWSKRSRKENKDWYALQKTRYFLHITPLSILNTVLRHVSEHRCLINMQSEERITMQAGQRTLSANSLVSTLALGSGFPYSRSRRRFSNKYDSWSSVSSRHTQFPTGNVWNMRNSPKA